MPVVRKLTDDEVASVEGRALGERARTARQYDTFLSEFELGDYGQVELAEDDKRLTVRNRLLAAAERRGAGLMFRRTIGPRLIFRLVDPAEQTSADTESDDATDGAAPKRRGRPARAASESDGAAPKRRGRKPKNQDS